MYLTVEMFNISDVRFSVGKTCRISDACFSACRLSNGKACRLSNALYMYAVGC